MRKTYLTFDDVQIRPRYSEIESRSKVDTTSMLTRNYTIKTPIVGAPMDTVCGYNMMIALANHGAAGCLHRFLTISEQVEETAFIYRSLSTFFNPFPLIAAIGATGDYQERAEKLVGAGANILLIDVAHGDHLHVKNAMKWINIQPWRSKVDIILGNVATWEGAKRLEDWGADAVRVGIGGGSMCTTRINTGVGVPQISAVEEIANSDIQIPIISDGGIRYPGDVAKALAAGADTVMLGGMLAGTIESPGAPLTIGNVKFKVFRGSASASAKADFTGKIQNVEGASRLVEQRGHASEVVQSLVDGLRSAMSYVGADNLIQFRAKAELIQITTAGLHEAHPHGMK